MKTFAFSSSARKERNSDKASERKISVSVIEREKAEIMEAQEGKQEPQLILAHKLFLLRQPDVPDIEKVQLREDVFAAVKADGNRCFLLFCLRL